MAEFNFEIKRQSYQIALKQTQDALTAGDTNNGKYYASRALDLCGQLVQHSVVAQMKERYEAEQRKLSALVASLDKGINPFTAKPASNSAGGAPSAAKPSGSASASSGAPAGKEGGKSEFFADEVPKTTLDDVAGLDDVKKQIRLRVIAPMKDPALYKKYMDDAGCQILMYGPPGCGKSYVAEAIAGELGCAYAILNVSDLLDKYVGEGPKRLVQIFKDAQKYDSCLIFFDELDSVFASRESDDSRHTKDLLTTFLTCLSGFHTSDDGGIKVIIGATNRPWALDSALIRGKRFDTHIYVGLPDEDARRFLVNKGFKKNKTLLENSDLTVDKLVEMFDGYSCADISSMIGKMKTRAFERALDNHDRGIEEDVPVTLADAQEVISGYRNSVTEESLEAFKAFSKGEI